MDEDTIGRITVIMTLFVVFVTYLQLTVNLQEGIEAAKVQLERGAQVVTNGATANHGLSMRKSTSRYLQTSTCPKWQGKGFSARARPFLQVPWVDTDRVISGIAVVILGSVQETPLGGPTDGFSRKLEEGSFRDYGPLYIAPSQGLSYLGGV